jgi:hypothetical protein
MIGFWLEKQVSCHSGARRGQLVNRKSQIARLFARFPTSVLATVLLS